MYTCFTSLALFHLKVQTVLRYNKKHSNVFLSQEVIKSGQAQDILDPVFCRLWPIGCVWMFTVVSGCADHGVGPAEIRLLWEVWASHRRKSPHQEPHWVPCQKIHGEGRMHRRGERVFFFFVIWKCKEIEKLQNMINTKHKL